MSDTFDQTPRNFVHRLPDRGTLSKGEIFSILDIGFLCHVAFQLDGQPFVVPTLYARSGDQLYLHGSAASRMLREVDKGIPVCISVTHVDGLVIARSAFHHSVNYRSAVLFGTASIVDDPMRKIEALRLFTNWIVRDRWEELRPSTDQELKATSVLEMTIEEASGKSRAGLPVDAPEDLRLPVWAGVLPMNTTFEPPINDIHNLSGLPAFDMRRVARLGRVPLSVLSYEHPPSIANVKGLF